MNVHDATERAYKNGYARGWQDAMEAKKGDSWICRIMKRISTMLKTGMHRKP